METEPNTSRRKRQQRALPTITQERFWHERTVEHQQRLLIIGLLSEIRDLLRKQSRVRNGIDLNFSHSGANGNPNQRHLEHRNHQPH
jgi:hypothetical protein